MTILILHQKRSSLRYPQTQYIGRPTVLGNPFTHLEKDTKALFKVTSVEEAIRCYRNWLYKEIQQNVAVRKELMRLIAMYQRDGILYLSCWCMDELDPRRYDHGCHCEVIREFIYTTYPVMRYFKTIRNVDFK